MTIKRIPLATIRTAWSDETLTKAEVAARLGISKGTLRAWAVLLPLPERPKHVGGRKLAQVDPATFTRVWERGDRVVDIAARFKRSPATISKIARRLDLDQRNCVRRAGQ